MASDIISTISDLIKWIIDTVKNSKISFEFFIVTLFSSYSMIKKWIVKPSQLNNPEFLNSK